MFNKTVDGAVKTLRKVVADLNAVAKAKVEEGARISREINRLNTERHLANTERDRASRITAKIEELLQ